MSRLSGSKAIQRTQPKWDANTVDNFQGACQVGVGMVGAVGFNARADALRLAALFVVVVVDKPNEDDGSAKGPLFGLLFNPAAAVVCWTTIIVVLVALDG
jgi:hypothetical protein